MVMMIIIIMMMMYYQVTTNKTNTNLVNLNQKSMVLGHADFEKHLYEAVVWNIYSKMLLW